MGRECAASPVAVACVCCIYGNRAVYDVGSVLLLLGCGFYAPIAPIILSVGAWRACED